MNYIGKKQPQLIDPKVLINLVNNSDIKPSSNFFLDNIYYIVFGLIAIFLYYCYVTHKARKEALAVCIVDRPIYKSRTIYPENVIYGKEMRERNLADYKPKTTRKPSTQYTYSNKQDLPTMPLDNIYGQPIYKFYDDNWVEDMPIIKNDIVIPYSSKPIIDEFYNEY